MDGRDEHRVPKELEGVARRLRAERPQLEAMELDKIKTRVMARARTPHLRGGALRGRILVAALTLGLMGAGAGGVMATGGGPTTSGVMSATAQYAPAKCSPQNGNCKCPQHAVFTTAHNGTPQCYCPDSSMFNQNLTACQCPKGTQWNSAGTACVSSTTARDVVRRRRAYLHRKHRAKLKHNIQKAHVKT